MMADYAYTISYGKLAVPFYRVYARPLSGLRPVPESSFTGRDNVLLAAQVDVEVFGENFLPAYTKGDNTHVVATDSMKNFVLRQALDYDGATLEGFLDVLGHRFLAMYADMEALRLSRVRGKRRALPSHARRLLDRHPRLPSPRGRVYTGRAPMRARRLAAAQGYRQLLHQLRA